MALAMPVLDSQCATTLAKPVPPSRNTQHKIRAKSKIGNTNVSNDEFKWKLGREGGFHHS